MLRLQVYVAMSDLTLGVGDLNSDLRTLRTSTCTCCTISQFPHKILKVKIQTNLHLRGFPASSGSGPCNPFLVVMFSLVKAHYSDLFLSPCLLLCPTDFICILLWNTVVATFLWPRLPRIMSVSHDSHFYKIPFPREVTVTSPRNWDVAIWGSAI